MSYKIEKDRHNIDYYIIYCDVEFNDQCEHSITLDYCLDIKEARGKANKEGWHCCNECRIDICQSCARKMGIVNR